MYQYYVPVLYCCTTGAAAAAARYRYNMGVVVWLLVERDSLGVISSDTACRGGKKNGEESVGSRAAAAAAAAAAGSARFLSLVKPTLQPPQYLARPVIIAGRPANRAVGALQCSTPSWWTLH